MRGLVLKADWQPKDGYVVTPAEERSRRARLGNMVWKNPTVDVGFRPDPVLESDHDVVVRNRACGICGSDVHLFIPDKDGYLDFAYFAHVPIAIGHEYAGEVVAVGAAVTRVKPGDLVAIEGQVNCGSCRACLRGHTSCCAFIEDRGFTLDGGAATLSITHERHCWPLTDVADRYGDAYACDVGALAEPASVVYNGMVNLAGGFVPGDTVAVFGCGPIGLAAIGLAAALGAGRILAVEPSAPKRELAVTLGATATFDPTSGDAAAWLLEESKGIGVDMALDASGVGRIVIPSILASLAAGAKIVLLGLNREPVEIDTMALTVRSASIYSPIAHLGGGFPAVIALHAAGRLNLTPMITARFGLEDGVAALERAAKGEDAKIMIHPQGLG